MTPPMIRAGAAPRDLLSGMAHELRTPLNLVIGFADSLSRNPECPAPQIRDHANAIHGAGQQLLGLVNLWLDVTRLEQGEIALQSDLIDIAALLDASAQAAIARVSDGAMRLDVIPPNGAPRLRGDERQLRQMITHLLSQALTFMQPGRQVVLRGEIAASGELRLVVHDIGLAAGLGLYLTRALAEAHGGSLTLDETGSQVVAVITLPAARLLPASSHDLLQELS